MTEPLVTCDEFDAGADELALGLLDEPARSRLLEHAAGCPRCQALLDDLVGLGERLLLVAPQHDPPAGFEGRALDRMGGNGAGAIGRRPWRWLVSAALVVAALAAGVGVGRIVTETRRETPAAPQGVIVSSAGTDVGTVTLVLEPEPHVLVAVGSPTPATGVRTCQLRLPDGGWVTVGSWTYDEIATGIWAAGIDPALLDAVAMQVVDGQGQVLATASID